MSVSSCLEETRLHTFETEGFPADYDCHASYRFIERKPASDFSAGFPSAPGRFRPSP
jgi:hypothetical protein